MFNRQKRLQKAHDLICNASDEEKRELFRSSIERLERHYETLEAEENRLEPHEHTAHMAALAMQTFMRRLTSYNAGWVYDAVAKHCHKSGRPKRYSNDDREEHNTFIRMMVNRGSSETQAMKLLMQLKGDKAMTEGFMKELRDSYKAYRNSEAYEHYDDSTPEMEIVQNAVWVSSFLEYQVDEITPTGEKSFLKTVDAFNLLWGQTITHMKKMHPVIRKHDSCYPHLFGDVIGWLDEEHADAISYFYGRTTEDPKDPYRWRREFNNYLNAMYFFMDNEKHFAN